MEEKPRRHVSMATLNGKKAQECWQLSHGFGSCGFYLHGKMTIGELGSTLARDAKEFRNMEKANIPLFTETFLEKLRSLRVDCVLLHETLENVLLTSGVCKKYTDSRIKNGYYYDSTDDGHSRVGSEYDFETEFNKKYKALLLEASRRKKRMMEENDERMNRIYMRRYHNESPQKSPSPPRPYMFPTAVTKRRHSYSDSGRSTRRSSGASSGTSSRRTTTQSRHSRAGPVKKPSTWFPRTTIPEPFQMTIREKTAPTKARFADKFLKQLLADKELKERKELEELKIKFRANPVPVTTYNPNSTFYVRNLKRSKSLAALRAEKIDKLKRAESQPELVSQPFHANPVPITTYIRPSTSMNDLREAKKNQRAVELLANSWAPRGLDDHATRSHVVYQVRHVPKCLPEKPSFRPDVSKSVPDFRLLHRKWEERLQRVAHRPTTVSFPFHFYENYHRHHCRNIDEYQPYYRQNNSKRQNFYSRTSSSGVSRKSYTST
uniref:TPX2 C-terminal domain-containing protein n=1 Tax=Acrobeloides nanus TaxID=290746 RepID=A0A914EB78_9BILA